MADDEEIVVAIEPEGVTTASGERDVKRPSEQLRDAGGKFKAAEPVEHAAQQLEAMEAEKNRERAARLSAERDANLAREREAAAVRERDSARTEAAESQYGTVAAGIESWKTEVTAAKAALKVAHEAGDYDAVVNAQERLAEAKAHLVRLDEAKADLDARKTEKRQPESETRRTDSPPQSAGDPVEQFLASRTPKTQGWLRDHPDLARAIAMNVAGRASTEESRRARKINAAHEDALAEGNEVDTPGYFRHIETFLGLTKEASTTSTTGNGADRQAQTKPRRQSVPVAPVQQSGGTNGGGTEVRLSQREATAATDGTHVWNYDDPSPQKRFKRGDPIGVQEFARRKHEMQKQGLYDRSVVS